MKLTWFNEVNRVESKMAYAAEKKSNRNSSCCSNCYNFIGNLNKIIQIAAINTHIEFKGWWVTSHKTHCGISPPPKN